MAHTLFCKIINVIQETIVLKSTQEKYFNSWKGSKNSGQCFSRKTKLTLEIVFWLIVSRIVQSLPVSLASFFDRMNLRIPTKGAFSMKRSLIKSEFFEDISQRVVTEYYARCESLKKWHGYVVLACDGSTVALPDVEELGKEYGYYRGTGGNLYPSAKVAIFQDTLNNITVLAKCVHKNVDERQTFMENFIRANELAGGKTIMTLDRGYFSYLLMYLMIKNRQPFVMKACEVPWKKAFLRSRKKETVVNIVPTKTTAIYSNREWLAEKDRTLTLRLVRFKHPNGKADVLITNIMTPETASAKEIIGLYRLRWVAETAYGVYKNDMALELFSTFRTDGIQQDFHAAIIMYNLASILASDAGGQRDNRKPDMNVAVGLMHNLCPAIASGDSPRRLQKRIRTDSDYLSRCLTYVIPGRSFRRKRRIRKTSGKFYRDTNFAMAV